MDATALGQRLDRQWDDSILPQLVEYVRIPNKSPAFDPQWEKHGHMERAVELIARWCREQPLPGMEVEVHRLPGRTPLLLIDVPGELQDSVLLYGHLDKQPEFTGWLPGLGAWEPVIRDGKLYGRGGADDGYAAFASLAAICALKEQKVSLPRFVLLIEACEESLSVDLPAHLEALGERIGDPSLVVCLDAECGNYDQLWCTTSLRGNMIGTLSIRVLKEGIHSGLATGIAPTPVRIAIELLTRLENPLTGEMLIGELQTEVPRDRLAQIAIAAKALGAAVAGKVPFADGVRPVSTDPAQLIRNNTWAATLAVTGADGLPPVMSAGNVLLPEIALKLSLRLPPNCDAKRAYQAVRRTLETDPPYGAQVRFDSVGPMSGWNAPPFAPWLEESMNNASRLVFGREAVHTGVGGTIPFMGMLGERFPKTQFFITGLLGPQSNAHGPNEFLHIEYAKKLTRCVALVLADHAREVRRRSAL